MFERLIDLISHQGVRRVEAGRKALGAAVERMNVAKRPAGGRERTEFVIAVRGVLSQEWESPGIGGKTIDLMVPKNGLKKLPSVLSRR